MIFQTADAHPTEHLLLTDVNGLKSQLTEIEQKMARRGGTQSSDDRKTLGELVVESEDVKSRLLGGPKKGSVNLSLETKAIVSGSGSWGSTASVTSSLVVARYWSGSSFGKR